MIEDDHMLTPIGVSTVRTGELCSCGHELAFPVLMGEQGLELDRDNAICTTGEDHE